MATKRRKPSRSRKSARRPARARAAARAILAGFVQDRNTGLPVNNAMVKIVGGSNFGRTTFTNAIGLYALKNLALGRNLVEASKGAKVQEKDKTLVAGLNILNFTL
jgi:hypothetical protein